MDDSHLALSVILSLLRIVSSFVYQYSTRFYGMVDRLINNNDDADEF